MNVTNCTLGAQLKNHISITSSIINGQIKDPSQNLSRG